MCIRDRTNAASHLRINEIRVGTSATLQFNAMSNKTYNVHYTPALPSSGWTKLADVVARATNHVETLLDPVLSLIHI